VESEILTEKDDDTLENEIQPEKMMINSLKLRYILKIKERWGK